jgi:MarR family transcriptional regulator, organic hydroperoxide resistance regulator
MEMSDRSVEVITLVKDILHLLRQFMHKGFEDIGMTGPQGMTMGILFKFKKMKISDLSDHLGLSNSTVSGIIDRLETQNFVERVRSKEDKRVVYVTVCPKFEEMHKGFHQIVETNIQNIIDRGTTEEIDKIVDGFSTLKKLLTDYKK